MSQVESNAGGALETFEYDDVIVRRFMFATILWALVGMGAGVVVALLLILPWAIEKVPALDFMGVVFDYGFLSFGRLRPLHTNAAIFAFAGNGIFTAVYYSTQRLCKARMFSDMLSRVHFWGWQLIIVSAALTIPFGITQSREYAELEWPIDIAITLVWVVFAINFFGTLIRRRERHLYVALWFYIATIVTVAVLHIGNNLWIPVGLVHFVQTGEIGSIDQFMKSYTWYPGVQDAFMQWWYGHNAVAFFLTTPFLGLMYYFLPKAAERPVFSYRLSIVHFWSLVFIYIWAGPHHLHYTALPEWASTLGMLFSVMLWMPSWGGMINGLLTLRGAWNRVAADPVLKFFVIGVTFYGMSTFEGPLLSIKSVNSLSHYTDWTIGHVHGGTLGWNGFMTFGMLYWLAPRLFQCGRMWSKSLMEWHFWLGTVGIFSYWLSMYVAGMTQGLMWRAFDETGSLQYPDFVETVMVLMPHYTIRFAGGTLYLIGLLIFMYNMFRTWRMRPKSYAPSEHQAAPLSADYRDPRTPESDLSNVIDAGRKVDLFIQGFWHRRWERLPIRFTVWVAVAVLTASAFEIIPTFLVPSNVPKIATVTPYTPLELYGRDIYVAEGCYNCHSQMVRPIRAETVRYGEYSKPGEFRYDHPFQWGSRRIGPDLHRVGGKYSHDWHVNHLEDPRSMVTGSIMPAFAWLLEQDTPYDVIPSRMRAMNMFPLQDRIYTDAEIESAVENARAQALAIYAELHQQGNLNAPPGEPPTAETRPGFADKRVIALVAYLQRVGTDIRKTPEAPEPAEGGTQ